jgi:HPt (histidine-containing phosphotransfer) domain-containing protein
VTTDSSSTHVDLERFRSDLRDAGVEEMVDALLLTFMEDCSGRFAALEKAAREGDAKAIESAAHAFKSGAGTIRASVLAERLASVEAAAHSGRLESIAALLDQVRDEHVAVLRQLKTKLNQA